MSIAATENAGLGPCELPLSDQWLSHAQLSQTSATHLSHQSINSALLSPRSVGNNNNTTANNNFGHHLEQQQQQHTLQQSPSHHQQIQIIQTSTKIMNAVASAVACPPTASKKIRRRPDNKPQSQINKCNNEKRRREQENEYIEQLGEFIHINKRDMNAPKPDKAAILNEVVKHYNKLFEKGNRKCLPNCSDSCTIHPVQQGDVSSTEPLLPELSLNGQQNPDQAATLGAFEHYISSFGWALLQINADGIIETVTENIKDLIRFTRADLLKQPIYSYLHPGDHAKLSPIFNNNMSFQLSNWDRQEDGQNANSKRNIQKRIRMLVKHPEGAAETMEQKQQRQDKYEEVIIHAAVPFNKDNGDDSSPVVCLITRPEDESSIEATMQQSQQQQQQLEQLTLRLDTQGRVLKINTEKLRPAYANSLTKDNCRSLHDITHIQDLPRMQDHLTDVLQNKSAQSAPYRIRLGPDVYVHVKAFSQLFQNTKPSECDFIMCMNTVLTDSELAALETGSNKNPLSLPSTSQVTSHHSSMGGPLMTSVINGTVSQVPNSRPNNMVNSYSSSPAQEHMFSSDSFDFPFHTDSFDINGMESVGVGWDSRPDSRTSVTPVSTPRPPSVSAYSPVAAVCPSPLTNYHGGQPSPSNNNNNNNNNNNLNNNNSVYGAFSFPNYDEKDSKEQVQQHVQHQMMQQQLHNSQQMQKQQTPNHNSERLRNLLTKRPQANAGSSGSDNEHDQRSQNKILKGLLDAEEEKDNNVAFNKLNAPNQQQHQQQQHQQHQQHQQQQQRLSHQRPGIIDSKTDNPMLMHLLNNDDDNMDGRSNQRNNSELLRQLQKEDTPKDHHHTNSNAIGNEELIQMLRFQGNDFTNRKRSANDADDSPSAKRTEDKPSKLREKNKMLASLLSNPSKAPTTFTTMPVVKTIPDIPQSRISNSGVAQQQSPQSIPHTQKIQQQMVNLQQQQMHQPRTPSQQQQQQQQLSQQMTSQQVRKPSDLYLNQQMPTPQLNKNHPIMQPPVTTTTRQQDFHFDTGSYTTSTAVTPIQPQSGGDSELSDIVNSVIDLLPEYQGNMLGAIMQESSANVSTPSQPQSQEDISEKMAINAITKSLMQIESTGVFNSSPPAYSMHNVNTQSGQQGFPPPPVYTQRTIRMNQMTTNNNNANSNVNNSPQTNPALRVQLQQQMQREALLQQQQQKERLLQQQQKQSLVVPVNATANADQLYLNPGMSNYELLNNVPPNVSLQRSANVVPDSQLSPGFSPNLLTQQLSPNQRAPFSPQSNQGIGYQAYNPNTGQRLSPQQQQQLNQQQMAFQSGTNTNSNSQLSPRQPPFPQVNQTNSQQQQTQPNQPQSQQQQQQQWNQSAIPPRLTAQQQQNPMLNAQLQSGYANARQFQAQRQRGLNSPATPNMRQNSFSESGFPEPPSPTTQSAYGPPPNLFNNQQMRMQRQTSIPNATQHLPGSPRSYSDTPYGMMYNNMHPSGTANDYYGRTQGVNNDRLHSSEFVRRELRTMVSERTQMNNARPPQSPIGPNAIMGSGGTNTNSNANTNNNNSNNSALSMAAQQQQQQQMTTNPMMTSSTEMGYFDLPTSGTTVLDTKTSASQWTSGETVAPRSSISEEVQIGDPKSSSLLLQKLLSD